jgi:hypothetical protein
MDTELRRALDVLRADVMKAIADMEARILHAIESPPTRLDAMARKLEGIPDEEIADPDIPRIDAGH